MCITYRDLFLLFGWLLLVVCQPFLVSHISLGLRCGSPLFESVLTRRCHQYENFLKTIRPTITLHRMDLHAIG